MRRDPVHSRRKLSRRTDHLRPFEQPFASTMAASHRTLIVRHHKDAVRKAPLESVATRRTGLLGKGIGDHTLQKQVPLERAAPAC